MAKPVFCQVPGCGRSWARDPCLEVACPSCRQPIGSPCRQPSGHNTWNSWGRFHPARDLAADAAGAYGACPFGKCSNAPGWIKDEPAVTTSSADQPELQF